jgi:hypothetical protein
VPIDRAVSLADFDRYIEEHGIPAEDYPAAFALWLAEITGGPVPRFEKVDREEPADGVVIEGDADYIRLRLRPAIWWCRPGFVEELKKIDERMLHRNDATAPCSRSRQHFEVSIQRCKPAAKDRVVLVLKLARKGRIAEAIASNLAA